MGGRLIKRGSREGVLVCCEIHILGSEFLLGSDSAAWQTRQIRNRYHLFLLSLMSQTCVGVGSQPMALQNGRSPPAINPAPM